MIHRWILFFIIIYWFNLTYILLKKTLRTFVCFLSLRVLQPRSTSYVLDIRETELWKIPHDLPTKISSSICRFSIYDLQSSLCSYYSNCFPFWFFNFFLPLNLCLEIFKLSHIKSNFHIELRTRRDCINSSHILKNKCDS